MQASLATPRNTRNSLRTIALISLFFVLLAATAVAQNPVPTLNLPLSPAFKGPGAVAFTLTVNGTGFVSGATVLWNGSARTTTFVSSSKLTASINKTDVATAQTAIVTVSNPLPGGGVSNPAFFPVVKSGYTVAMQHLDVATATSPQSIVAADFNGDGKLDLATASSTNMISVLNGNGDGTFQAHQDYSAIGFPIVIAAGDFNGDGHPDLVTIDEHTSQVSIFLNSGTGTFPTHVEYATGNHPVNLAVGDVNGDGKLDVVVTNLSDNTVSVLLGNGDGTLQTAVAYATGNGPSAVAIADLNADNKLDLIVVNNTDNTVSILTGNGDGTFSTHTDFTTALVPNSVVVGDFNGDGKLDLAVGTSNKLFSVLLGNGDGTFQNHADYGIGNNSQVVGTADFSGDGKLDLVAANFNDNTISELNGTGTGTFNTQTVFLTGSGPLWMALGDFNNDGKLDVAVVNANASTVSILLQGGLVYSPSFLQFGTITSGVPSTKTVKVTNNTIGAVTLGTLAFVGANNTDYSQTNNCPASLAIGANCTYTVTFNPQLSEVTNVDGVNTLPDGSTTGFEITGAGNVPVTLSPRTLTFGNVLIGKKSTGKSVTFTNTSGVSIMISSIQLTGVNQTDYSYTTTCPIAPATLAAGKNCTATIFFTPTLVGGETVTIIFYGNFTLLRQGALVNGVGYSITVSPLTLTFPSTTVGTMSSAKTVTVTNSYSQPVAITSISFGGLNNDFTQTNTCAGSVPANGSCTVSVTFTPGAVGARSAFMLIGDPDPTGPQTVNLSGTGK